MSDLPIGVLLGADSLLSIRSGVGRQTLEVAWQLRLNAAVGELALLMGERCIAANALDALTDSAVPAPSSGAARTIAAAIPGAATVRAALRRRRMNRYAAAMAQRTNGCVVYHELNMIARPFDGVTVVTVHDLSWRANPRWHPAERVAWIERRLPHTLSQASRLICVSDFTAREVERHLGIAPSRIDVVCPGVSAIFRPRPREAAQPTLAQFDLSDRGYLLAVSTLEPRKNLDGLLAAHTMLPHAVRQRFPLAVAGARGWGEVLTDARADRARRDGTLRLLGFVPDDDLAALYSRSAAVAYVSLYEGFGLPVLEAMACGAPVVASRCTAVGGTAGDAALLVDPRDTTAMTDALNRVLTDQVLASELTRHGTQRATGFDWDVMAQGLVASWRKAVEQSDHQPDDQTEQSPEQAADRAGSDKSGRGVERRGRATDDLQFAGPSLRRGEVGVQMTHERPSPDARNVTAR